MIGDNLQYLLKLYYRPLAAISAIIDKGSLIFAAAAVLSVSMLVDATTSARIYRAYEAPVMRASAQRLAHQDTPPVPTEAQDLRPMVFWLVSFSTLSTLQSVLGLSLLYVPALILLMTLLEHVGSFGVAFRRDFGALLACTLMAWAAARLPFALAALALPEAASPWALVALWVAGGVYFAALMVLVLRTVFGAHVGSGIVAVGLAWTSFALLPYLAFLASPLFIYWGYQFFWGDIADVSWSFGARQNFKHYLEASTINPRDAGAHYQLGLIYQRRRQWQEAQARFARSVEIDPAEVDAHYQLARIARQQQRHADAIKHFEEVVARDERHSRHEIWREIGATYLESSSYEHARWALEKYVEQRPHDPEGLFHLATALQKLGLEDAARVQFERCIEAVDTTPRYRHHEVRRWRSLAKSLVRPRSVA